MNRRFESIALSCLLAFAGAAQAAAQSAVEEPSEAKVVFGPLGLTPRIALKNVGVDTNPLNQSANPDRDFTATIVPGLDSTLRMGRGRLLARTSLEYVHFNRLHTQRSININQELRAQLSLNRVTPYASGAYLRTRQRPSPEVDLRVQQNTTQAGLGTEIQAGARLRFDVEARRSRYQFGEGRHGDVGIASALDREATTGRVAARYALTPLTTFVVSSELRRERFRLAEFRNSDSVFVMPGLELKPSALISGKVAVGYQDFNAVDPGVPDFAGVVGKMEILYVMRESTAFALTAARDIEYSIDPAQPYYVQNAGLLTVTQMLGGDWFLVGRLGETRLAYRDFLPSAGSSVLSHGRSDRVLTRGGGAGRRLREDLRIGVDVDYVSRRSTTTFQNYEGFRFGGSITYGS